MEKKEHTNKVKLAWIKKRKETWFKQNGPCVKCNSWKNLELDHINPSTKITHRIWSRNEEFRKNELKKCQVLCKICHKEKTKKDLHNMNINKKIYSKLSVKLVCYKIVKNY